ncbi:MAG: hypothetical protein HFE82_02600 [Erysipelotrichaceae bacterium]|nr:hypothetical protein [Erysipelotrichaceae bacterium]
MKFNSKIFSVALIPLYCYALLCAYAVTQAHYEWSLSDTLAACGISAALLAAGVLISLRKRIQHRIGLLLYMAVGCIGIYNGLIADEVMNWAQIIASAFVFAFGISFYETVERHYEAWHEEA